MTAPLSAALLTAPLSAALLTAPLSAALLTAPALMSGVFAAKLVLVPSLIAAITLAGVRFGPRVAGALTGFPVVAGPIVFFMALEQGAPFAARSAVATLSGIASLGVFGVLYAWMAARASWAVSVVVGWLGFLGATLVFDRLDLRLAAAAALAVVVPLVMLALIPRPERIATNGPVGATIGTTEILLRMLAGVMLMLVLTGIAHVLGPRLSGLLTVFPIAATVLAVFSHRQQGAAFAAQLLRGLALGLYSLSGFFTTLAIMLEPWGLAPAFLAAIAAAIGAQLVVLNLQSQA